MEPLRFEDAIEHRPAWRAGHRAGRGIVLRLMEEFHRAGQFVANRGEASLNAPGKINVRQPDFSGQIQEPVRRPSNRGESRQARQHAQPAVVEADDVIQKP